jgi:nicotinamidase-related amidase
MSKINRKQALQRIAVTSGLLALHNISNAVTPASDETDQTKNAMKNFQDNAIDWSTAALIIVDMQNDFVRSGAPLEVASALRTVPALSNLIQAFHKHHLPVVYTKFISHPHYYLLWEWSPQCQPPTKCCWKGHQRYYKDIGASRDCTEIIDELQPTATDIIVEKFGYGAFHDTALDKTLRSLGVSTLIVTGTVTQICVEETVREAFHHGYRTIIAEDGVSSFAPDLHAATLKNFAMKFGWVSNSDHLISGINTLK